jgi:hypothetical protein
MPDEATEKQRRQRQEEMTGMTMPQDALTEFKGYTRLLYFAIIVLFLGLFALPDSHHEPYFSQIYFEETPVEGNLDSAYDLCQKYNTVGI